jgi:hypothetical protein
VEAFIADSDLWTGVEVEVACLYDRLGGSQEHKIKPKELAHTDFDERVIGTNRPYGAMASLPTGPDASVYDFQRADEAT